MDKFWSAIEPRLIDGWRCGYKLATVWIAAAIVIISASSEYLPALQQYLPADWVKWMGVAIIVARMIKQTPTTPKD